MDVDVNENTEELSFIPSTVSNSGDWHEPQFMCDKQCRRKGFKYSHIASVVVGDDGEPHTKKHCKEFYKKRKDGAGCTQEGVENVGR